MINNQTNLSPAPAVKSVPVPAVLLEPTKIEPSPAQAPVPAPAPPAAPASNPPAATAKIVLKEQPTATPEQRPTTPKAPTEPRDPESQADASERVPKEDFIFPSNNDAYHEKILSLLKISNNKPLNMLYYKVVPQISKGNLLMLDLSSVVSLRHTS